MNYSKKNARLLAVLASLIVAISVGWMALATVQRVELSNRELASTELPQFGKVYALQSALARQTLLFHKYYLTGDSADFNQNYTLEAAEISLITASLENDLGDDAMLSELVTLNEQIHDITQRMRTVMSPPTDWDGAREVLAQFEPLTESINSLSRGLIEHIEAQVVHRVHDSLGHTENSLAWTFTLTGGVLTALLLMLWVDARREAARQAQQRTEQALRQLAYFDTLTGLPNRAAFEERYTTQGLLASTSILVLMDILRLPQIGSRLGYSALRDAVAHCARILLDRSEKINAQLFHFDGKHFAMVIPHANVEQAMHDLTELRTTFSEPFKLKGLEFFLDLAVGLTEFPSDEEMEQVLRRSTIASRAVQPNGGLQRYDAVLEKKTRNRIDLEADLRHAIERNELSLHLQPQLALATNHVIGAEALLRWQRRDGSWVSPAEFIPLAEESGLMNEIGIWVLEQAFSVADKWSKRHSIPLTMAINISAHQLLGGQLCAQVKHLLQQFSLDATSIELEITESAALFDIEAAIAAMMELRALGVHLALDDFGTGYSAFSYLTRLPLDKLKIDQSFVHNMLNDERHEAVARSIVALAKPLSLTVIAEGVEKEAQLLQLTQWGCHEIQGYLLARPMPIDQFDHWLDHYQSKPWCRSATDKKSNI